MDCRDIQLQITLQLDGASTGEQETALREHLVICPSCAAELALQERLSRALRDMGSSEVEAPPELCGLVMGKIRAERRKVIPWLPAAWRKSMAAAAALLIIAGGSLGLNASLKQPGDWPKVAYETSPPVTVTDKGNVPGADRESSVSPSDTTNISSDIQTVNAFNDMGAAETSAPVPSAAPSIANSVAPVTTANATTASESRAMLSSSMKVTSTVIKVAVNDLTEARIKSVALAAGAGATQQVFPEQNGGRSILVIRNTVESGKAPELIAALSRLGTLIDRQDESRDITNLYNETMVQYQDLISRVKLAKDNEEKRRLEAQAVSYKQQLDAWEAESSKRVVMLWLESN